MKYYVTQYFETRGILEIDTEDSHFDFVEVSPNGDLKFQGRFDFNRTSHYWFVGREHWFLNYADALKDAEQKKATRISKVAAQLERLKALSFPPFPANARSLFLNPAPDAENSEHTASLNS